MTVFGNVPQSSTDRLAARIAGFREECILRVRRGATWWEGSNRPSAPPSDEPFTAAFRTASVTKTFTASLIFLLMEDGALALDDRLSDFLPDQLCSKIHVLNGTSFGRDITLRQLLCHRSGVFDYATSPSFIKQVLENPKKVWGPQDLLEQAIQGGAPYFSPDKAVLYSDTGYVLLALAIEAVAGMSLAAVYRSRIIEPLGLAHTYLEGQESPIEWPVSHAFTGKVDTFDIDPSFDTFGGGGLVATARDLDSFITCLLHGAIFEKAFTLHQMMQGTPTARGTGTRKTKTSAGISKFSLAGRTVWGHLGHWNSFMLHSIEDDLSICGTFNQANESPLQKIILEESVREAISWGIRK